MKKIKSCMFLLLTLLFSVQVFAFDAVPPDKTMFELELMSSDYVENGVIETNDQEPSLINKNFEKRLTAKTLSINQHSSGFKSISYDVNKVAVVQNQNFDRMYNL